MQGLCFVDTPSRQRCRSPPLRSGRLLLQAMPQKNLLGNSKRSSIHIRKTISTARLTLNQSQNFQHRGHGKHTEFLFLSPLLIFLFLLCVKSFLKAREFPNPYCPTVTSLPRARIAPSVQGQCVRGARARGRVSRRDLRGVIRKDKCPASCAGQT